MSKSWTNYLFILTLTFFSLSFFNVIFGLLGLFCLLLPFVFLAKDGKKKWCQKYCPRANLFIRLFNNSKNPPDWLLSKGKWIFLVYFSINLLMIIMSTIRVSLGYMEPVEMIRFMIAFPLITDLPQFIQLGPIADWLIHLSYRLYSMMFTTVVFGLILGALFLPRTWCRVCPVNTVSDLVLRNANIEKYNYSLTQKPIKKSPNLKGRA